MFTIVLLQLLLLAQSWIVAVFGCGQIACFPPTEANTTLSTIYNQQKAITEARCYSACLKKYEDLVPHTVYTDYGKWSSVPFAVLEAQTCATFQRVIDIVLECKGSCVARSDIQENLTDNQCRDLCFETCQNECPDGQPCSYGNFTNCPRLCRKTACRLGCVAYTEAMDQFIPGSVPASPVTELSLSQIDDSIIYNINFAIENETNSPIIRNPTSFVFRIEDLDDTHYIWQPSLSEPLDLSAYSCKSINISFAAVNKYGLSSYAPLTTVCVDGEYRYPEQVSISHIRVAFEEDLRQDFLSYSKVNFTWEHSAGFDYLHFYEIIIISQKSSSCMGWSEAVRISPLTKNTSTYVYEGSSPSNAMKFGCQYLAQIKSRPSRPGDQPAYFSFRPELSTEVADLQNLSCQRTVQPNNSISVSLSWAVENSSVVMTAISSFVVDISLLKLNSTVNNDIHSSEVQVQDHQIIYSYSSVSGLKSFIGTDMKYRIMVIPKQNLEFYWRPIPQAVTCYVDATVIPSPPTKISSVSVQSSTTDQFTVSWSPPDLPHGTISLYQLLIGTHPVAPSELGQSILEQYYVLNITGNVTNAQVISSEINVSCNQLQVRSFNNFEWSNWSSSYPLSNLHLACVDMTTQTIPITTTPISLSLSTHSQVTPSLTTSSTATNVPSPTTPQVLDLQIFLYGLTAFTSLLLILGCAGILALICWRCLRVRADKVSAIESQVDLKATNKVAVDLLKVEQNIYETIPEVVLDGSPINHVTDNNMKIKSTSV